MISQLNTAARFAVQLAADTIKTHGLTEGANKRLAVRLACKKYGVSLEQFAAAAEQMSGEIAAQVR